MQEKPDTRTYEQRFKDLDKRVKALEDKDNLLTAGAAEDNLLTAGAAEILADMDRQRPDRERDDAIEQGRKMQP